MSSPFESPWACWSRDPRALCHLTEDELRRAFVVYFERTVSNDGLVSIDSVDYEVPRELGPNGRRGARIQVTQRILEGSYHVVAGDGRLVRIHPVDLVANARTPRGRRGRTTEAPATIDPPAKTAADLLFERELGPVVDADGNALPASADEPRDKQQQRPPPDEVHDEEAPQA